MTKGSTYFLRPRIDRLPNELGKAILGLRDHGQRYLEHELSSKRKRLTLPLVFYMKTGIYFCVLASGEGVYTPNTNSGVYDKLTIQ